MVIKYSVFITDLLSGAGAERRSGPFRAAAEAVNKMLRTTLVQLQFYLDTLITNMRISSIFLECLLIAFVESCSFKTKLIPN